MSDCLHCDINELINEYLKNAQEPVDRRACLDDRAEPRRVHPGGAAASAGRADGGLPATLGRRFWTAEDGERPRGIRRDDFLRIAIPL